MLIGVRRWANKAHWLTLLMVFLLSYVVYIALAIIGGFVLVWLADRFFPGTFFYHLQPDESPGPLGNLGAIGISVIANYLIFFAFLVPMARLLRVSLFATFLLAIFNVPIVWLFLYGVVLLVQSLGVHSQ